MLAGSEVRTTAATTSKRTFSFSNVAKQVWHHYLERMARIERNHLFNFNNLIHAPIGAMYALAQYNKTNAAACE